MEEGKVQSELNQLLARNYDSEKAYQQMAEKTDDPELQSFCEKNVEERYRFGHEIKDMIAEYGGKPDKGSTTSADLQRAWIDIKDKVTGKDPKAVLNAAEHGEDFAIENYETAVKNEELKPGHRRILSDHLHAIRNTKQQIHNLKSLV